MHIGYRLTYETQAYLYRTLKCTSLLTNQYKRWGGCGYMACKDTVESVNIVFAFCLDTFNVLRVKKNLISFKVPEFLVSNPISLQHYIFKTQTKKATIKDNIYY